MIDEKKFSEIMKSLSKKFSDEMKEQGIKKDNEYVYVVAGLTRWMLEVLSSSYPDGTGPGLPEVHRMYSETLLAMMPMMPTPTVDIDA